MENYKWILLFTISVTIFWWKSDKKEDTTAENVKIIQEENSTQIRGNEISYQASDFTILNGYISRNTAATGKRPGIIVVNEWWGHDEFARLKANQTCWNGLRCLSTRYVWKR